MDRSVFFDKDGYPKIKINNKAKFVHRLSWELINGEVSRGMQINHIDGDKLNWNIANLEETTSGDNVRHAWANGLCSSSKGEKHGMSKLTDSIVMTIRTLPKKAANGRGYGFSSTELAKKYGVSEKVLRQARNGDSWRHLPLL
jgi:hypothetical protein